MKICVFSDIHGNVNALDMMLHKELQHVDHYYFLGDIFGYFIWQEQIIDKFMAMKNIFCIKGNHDRNYIRCLSDGQLAKKLRNKYGISYELRIPNYQLDFLKSMPEYIVEVIDGLHIGFFHEGPNDNLEQRLYPDSTILLDGSSLIYDIIFVGHTHYRFAKKIQKIQIINPGSLGQPRDNHGFSYCILDTIHKTFEFRTVDVNIKYLLHDIKLIENQSENYRYLYNKYNWS